MALAFTDIGPGNIPGVLGNRRAVVKQITFDNSYPINGEAITAANFGLQSIDFVDVVEQPDGWVVKFDRTNSKLKVFGQTPTSASATTVALVEADDTEDLSAAVCVVLVVGV